MSNLIEIWEQFETAISRVRTLERAAREHPELPSIAANLDSAKRIKEKLELQFAEAAATLGNDICSDRAVGDYEIPKSAKRRMKLAEKPSP